MGLVVPSRLANPVAAPERHAAEVLEWLRKQPV
jgi:hypothetical protein